MFAVSEIFDECAKVTGVDDENVIFRRITEAVEILANKGDWDPLYGLLDIRVNNGFVALPPEVEVIESLSIESTPAVARDQYFQFHLNGPGLNSQTLRYEWAGYGDSPVYAQPKPAAALVAVCSNPEDAGAELWAYGFNEKGEEIRTKLGENWVDGAAIPVAPTLTYANNPKFSRITRVRKAVTKGAVTLFAGPYALAVYRHGDTEPQFNRIKLFKDCEWIRIAYRRRTFRITSKTDLIPLHNRQAVILMVQALKKYLEPGGTAEAEALEATAMRWLSEEQSTRRPRAVIPLQVHEGAPTGGDTDYVD